MFVPLKNKTKTLLPDNGIKLCNSSKCVLFIGTIDWAVDIFGAGFGICHIVYYKKLFLVVLKFKCTCIFYCIYF